MTGTAQCEKQFVQREKRLPLPPRRDAASGRHKRSRGRRCGECLKIANAGTAICKARETSKKVYMRAPSVPQQRDITLMPTTMAQSPDAQPARKVARSRSEVDEGARVHRASVGVRHRPASNPQRQAAPSTLVLARAKKPRSSSTLAWAWQATEPCRSQCEEGFVSPEQSSACAPTPRLCRQT